MRYVRKLLIVGLVLLPLWCAAVAPYTPQIADPLLEPWRWREVDALKGQDILCMDQAPDGTYWFGCYGGIIRYSGMDAERIDFDEELVSRISHEVPRPRVPAVLCLDNDRLLVVVGRSLIVWSRGQCEIVVQEIKRSGAEILLKQASDGNIWLMTILGLWRISEDLSSSELLIKSTWRGMPLFSFCLTDAGGAWVVQKSPLQGVDLIHIPVVAGRVPPQQEWESSPVPVRTPGADVSIAVGADGRVWYADDHPENGIVGFDPQNRNWDSIGPDSMKQVYSSMTTTRDGTTWACGLGLLCAIRPPGGVLYPPSKLGLPSNPLRLFEADDDTWWLLGRIGRVFLMDRGHRHWMTYQGLHFQCESPDGRQWFISSDFRVVSHDPQTGEWVSYGTEDAVIAKPRLLICSKDGLIWAPGQHDERAAISIFDGSRWVLHRYPKFAADLCWKTACEAADGTLWFMASGYVLLDLPYSGGALQYEVVEGREPRLLKRHAAPWLPYTGIGIVQTADNTLWFGAVAVRRLEPGAAKFLTVWSVPRTATHDLAVDMQGELWLAKIGAGLFRNHNHGWIHYTHVDGLAGDHVGDILALADGTLLAASDRGISRFDGRDWMTWAFSADFAMTHFSGSMRQSRDGAIWLNFDRQDPRSPQVILNLEERFCTVRYISDRQPPQTRIEEYAELVSSLGDTYISWSGQDPFENSPRDVLQYSWRFSGDEWSPFSSESGRTFNNLAGGKYEFAVRARDRDLNIDPVPAMIRFTVMPHVWQRPWFVSMVLSFVALIVLLVWVMIRIRERNLTERQAARERLLTERQAEEQKRQAEREQHLVEMDQLKTGFFTNISHELRTPLTVILGPLQQMLATEKDGRRKKTLSMMERNANRVAALITQLLDFRKIEQGKIRVEATEGDLVRYVGELVASVQPLADINRVSCRLEGQEMCRGWFDPDKLEKIIVNLLSNAIKHTPTGGSVRVALREEAGENGYRQLVLVIEDTGTGIEQGHLARIFDRFYQIPEESIVDGSGIGLNLTRELVELWGGEITAESPVSEDVECPGTRFTVRLPIDREGLPAEVQIGSESTVIVTPSTEDESEEVAAEPPALSPDAEHAGDEDPLVLVVEDDPDVQAFIAGGLESRYRIVEAADGTEGLKKARQSVPDLVVTDLMMPVMDGVALCKELKRNPATSHIPVIMLTAKTSLEHQVKGLESGADDYILKPFHMVLLQTRIHNLLESRRMLRERFSRQLTQATQAAADLTVPEPKVSDLPVSENKADQEFWERVCRVLDENCGDPQFHADSLAPLVFMSRRSLQRKIKALTDRTTIQLIVEFRLKRAVRLLRESSMSVTDISFESGFGDLSHFYRRFKKEYGMNPSQYRDMTGK